MGRELTPSGLASWEPELGQRSQGGGNPINLSLYLFSLLQQILLSTNYVSDSVLGIESDKQNPSWSLNSNRRNRQQSTNNGVEYFRQREWYMHGS